MSETSLSQRLAGLDITVSQSRFHKETINDRATKDIDVRDLSISYGQRELLSHAHLHLEANSHYVFVGKNGAGKSTLLSALAHGGIPGIPSSLRIVLIGQDGVYGGSAQPEGNMPPAEPSVLQQLVKSDPYREQLLQEQRILSKASDQSEDTLALPRAYREFQLQDLRQELRIQTSIATYRSGARGFKARKELVNLEKNVKEAELYAEQPSELMTEESVAKETSLAIERLAAVDAQLAAIDSETPELRAGNILKGLGFKTAQINGSYENLSGGWRKRCSIATGLFRTSDILLLDEPTNFLDLPSILWLKSFVNSLNTKTVVVVTHDRDFGDDISSTLLLLKDAGITVFHGTLSSYIRETRKQARYLTKMKDAQEKQEQQIKQQISHHVQAAKKSGDDKKLKQATSRKKKLENRMGLTVSAKGGRFKLNRDLGGYYLKARADIEVPQLDPPPMMTLPQPPGLAVTGNLVSFDEVGFHYKGAKTYLLHGVNMKIGPGDRVGLTGLNGAGKSTLVKLMMGPELEASEGLLPAKGLITRASRMRVGYFSQSSVERKNGSTREEADTALQVVMGSAQDALGEPISEAEARSVLSGFGLTGRIVSDVPTHSLSGGQKVRVALASIFIKPPHLLVLDEVTCHLDADSVSALARALRGYEGAVVVVSHDRFFIRSVVEDMESRQDGGDEEASSSEDESDDGEFSSRKRSTLLVEKGVVKLLAGGITEYEEMCEGRVKKMKV